MTIAADRPQHPTTPARMTLEAYLTGDWGADGRYELVDGVLVDMGAENPLNPAIAMRLVFALARLGVPEEHLAIGHQIEVRSPHASARQPDLIVHSEASRAAIFGDGKLLRLNMLAPLMVVEVASSTKSDRQSRERDYTEKPAEYADRGILEYWVIDPDEGLVKVGRLENGRYQFQDFMGQQTISSLQFPGLTLTVNRLLDTGS
ncbi:MAG: hypothetical protein RLZZ511_2565 [Cyanobacteriota bacterium]|jgi:Uma2 family endonuclease